MEPFGDDLIERTVSIPGRDVLLQGTLGVPEGAVGIILFAHGSGSSRFSRRNRFVAHLLRNKKLGTLLLDLLSAEEERIDEVTRHHRFDIPMLADRVIAAIDWLAGEPDTRALSVGLFGASTGAAAALVAAAERPARVTAVVSRGGRPDLAADALTRVDAPTLLIVGQRDEVVIDLNRSARDQLHAEVRLVIVLGATHLFEEPGALERVADLAENWFVTHIAQSAPL
jgi:putative phosphoribosyl transferase